tara:strand:- start:542 stop:646 length:105 start_codon:yes stop_codon:yes gene_type:complete
MKIINFKSEPKNSPFAPEWARYSLVVWHLGKPFQ